VRAVFLPDKYPEFGQCVHKVTHHPSRPERLFLQNHWGLYRSDDGGDSWQDIANGVPSDFGFAMVMHPHDADTVYVVEMTDQNLAVGIILAAPSLVQDGLYDSSTPATLAPSLRGMNQAPATPIEPTTFWRSITSATRDFEFAFADSDTAGQPTTALVTVNWHFLGTLNIVPASAAPMSAGAVAMAADTDNIIRKPLADHWVRRVLLKRLHSDMDGVEHHDWHIAAISGVEVTSPEATSQILSVRVESATFDTTITDPLALIRLREILRFATDDSVNVTVTTGRADDVVLLYFGDHRDRMTNAGGNTYTGTLRAGSLEGWRHFGVNALSHGTLYDDSAAYDSKAWILPYVITTTPAVDYLP
jgi:hypothetical protein